MKPLTTRARLRRIGELLRGALGYLETNNALETKRNIMAALHLAESTSGYVWLDDKSTPTGHKEEKP